MVRPWPDGSLIRAEYGNDVLPVAEQAHDIEMAFSLEIQPLHGKASDTPGTQSREITHLPQARGTHRWHAFDGFERSNRCIEHALGEFDAALRRVVPRRVHQVGLRLWAQQCALQILPSACVFSCSIRLGVSAWPGPEFRPSAINSRKRFLAWSS